MMLRIVQGKKSRHDLKPACLAALSVARMAIPSLIKREQWCQDSSLHAIPKLLSRSEIQTPHKRVHLHLTRLQLPPPAPSTLISSSSMALNAKLTDKSYSPTKHDKLSADYRDCKRLNLPTGRVGISFAGRPPQINGVKDKSALAGLVMIGDEAEYVVGLTVPGIIEMHGFDQSELSYLLGRYSDVEGRVLLVSKKPVVDGRKKAMITLPRGKIGVIFAGSPPIVTMVREESPLHGLIAAGQIVVGLQIPNTLDFSSSDIDTSELVAILKANQHRDDRILVVSNEQDPVVQTPPRVAKRDLVMPPSDFAEPGGEWYLQQYCGGKSIAAAFCCLLLCGIIGVLPICMNLDERFIYLEPNNGRRFNTKGKIVGKGGKGLIPLPEGIVIPIKSPKKKKGKDSPGVNASAVHPFEE